MNANWVNLMLVGGFIIIIVAITTKFWLRPFFNFLRINSRVIQSLADFIQILLWCIGLLTLSWPYISRPPQSEPSPTPLPTYTATSLYTATTIDPTIKPVDTLTLTIIPTEIIVPTPTPTIVPTPTQVVLFKTHFEDYVFPDDWRVLTDSKPVIVDGVLFADSKFAFAVGDETWKNYKVRVNLLNFPDCGNYNVIGVRATSDFDYVKLRVCTVRADLWFGGKSIPGSWVPWPGGIIEITATDDHFKYFGKDTLLPGHSNGWVVIEVLPNVPIKEVEVIQLP